MDALNQIKDIYKNNFKESPFDIIEKVFCDVTELFEGKMKGFNKCDTMYHDIQHTQETALAMSQIMDGFNRRGNLPIISPRIFRLGVIASLLHDVGYIKETGDDKGSGAKYTFIHVNRGVNFAKKYLSSKGYDKNSISSIMGMMWCTLSHDGISNIKFSSKEEKTAAFSLGTADLLSQMAKHDYLKKLPILFDEFKEAYKYEGIEELKKKGHIVFHSADELIKNTPDYYESYVKNRFNEMGSVYQFIPLHFGNKKNHYLERIEKNLEKIKLL